MPASSGSEEPRKELPQTPSPTGHAVLFFEATCFLGSTKTPKGPHPFGEAPASLRHTSVPRKRKQLEESQEEAKKLKGEEEAWGGA